MTNDWGYHISADLRCAAQTKEHVTVKQKFVHPSNLTDAYCNWVPVPDGDDGEGLGLKSDVDDREPDTDGKQKVYLQCQSCVMELHALLPLHTMKEWNNIFLVEASLLSLGSDHANNLEQLMCNGWYPALMVDPATCATYVSLDLFRLLNVAGNINVHNFVGTLEQNTDPLGMNKVPITRLRIGQDLYKTFSHMACQYSSLSGRDTLVGCMNWNCWQGPRTVHALSSAGLARIIIRICQRAGEPFLYMLILAMDTSFRLMNQIHKNEIYDPLNGAGWGHLMEEPLYKAHLKSYVAEKDVHICIVFAALLQKDTCMTTGLQCSGMGGVVCMQHESVRPEGMGDPQKGEQYSNMDYILLSAITGITLMYLAISNDITCQWQDNLWEQMKKMLLHLQLEKPSIHFDGERIERTWAGFNPVAWATKEMGLGPHHDVLEDKINHHNFKKNVGQAEFEQVQINAWMADCTQPDPYELSNSSRKNVPTEAAVHLELTKEDAKGAVSGGSRLTGSSVSVFLTVGMQLESTQFRNQWEAKAEDVKLWLPSELPSGTQVVGCRAGLPEQEAQSSPAQPPG
ncbi:hypothetical protein C8J57DRAFT_1245082 [Mycena rebaudengoi]|nr:hypothetical protein C8J57DRAFT_1245082 [Mycena rebaudengoi]